MTRADTDRDENACTDPSSAADRMFTHANPLAIRSRICRDRSTVAFGADSCVYGALRVLADGDLNSQPKISSGRFRGGLYRNEFALFRRSGLLCAPKSWCI